MRSSEENALTSSIRLVSLARLIVYSMTPDGPAIPPSGISTLWTPGFVTPEPEKNFGDYLSAPLAQSGGRAKVKTYLGGSKALDSLSRLIVSTENFFHPSNAGSWTTDVRQFWFMTLRGLML